MNRRGDRRFRPCLEGSLEDRALLSRAGVVAHVSRPPAATDPGRPRITPEILDTVSLRIDEAFQRYRGVKSGGEVASGIVGSLLSSVLGGDSVDSSQDTQSPSERGDHTLLMNRLRTAVGRLPYGGAGLYPAIAEKVDPWFLTPENARSFHNWVKFRVRKFVADGLKHGDFVLTS